MEKTDFVAALFEGKADPNKATLAFALGKTALDKGHSATVMLMVHGVELGVPGAAKGIDIGAPFPALPDVMEGFLQSGGKVVVCGACMIHNGFTKEEMDPRFEIIDAPDVIDALMSAKGTLQIT